MCGSVVGQWEEKQHALLSATLIAAKYQISCMKIMGVVLSQNENPIHFDTPFSIHHAFFIEFHWHICIEHFLCWEGHSMYAC